MIFLFGQEVHFLGLTSGTGYGVVLERFKSHPVHHDALGMWMVRPQLMQDLKALFINIFTKPDVFARQPGHIFEMGNIKSTSTTDSNSGFL
ncbi:hypothetical protein [Pedobacter suwonensis]|uniref:hypothetical protein n=1 Tax=Pedobacter suwonensis TaxID=332999 RepID=UPI0036B08D99